ncbi:MAG: condensation domain-containing protein, partial [Longimicrobiaceae bacterium]
PGEALAFVVYTSGSTGRPKGVGVQHAELARHCRAAAEAYGLGPADRMLFFAALGFDVLFEDVLVPLAAGAGVVVRGADLPSPAELAALVREHGVTALNLPTAYWHQLAGDAAARDALKGGVRIVMPGGEAMRADAARAWAAAPGRGRLLNTYGPTEAVVTCAAFEVDDAFAEGADAIPLGRALGGRRVYVLDAALRLVPAGVAGELCVSGVLARGYLGRPGATAAAFVPDPFSGVPGARLYRTGDRVRWRTGTESAEVRECGSALNSSAEVRECESALTSDENQRTLAPSHSRTLVLEFLGRTDQQVKVRGFRIEPGEVEAALRAHPGVREAVVEARGADEARRLVAWIVAADGVTATGLKARLGARLAAWMVPSAFVFLDALPLTPNGKVDRRALPAPAAEPGAGAAAAARTPTQEVLGAIWAEVLGVERVGPDDSFFALGGHSLLAMRMVARARTLLGVELPLRVVFEASTLRELAARVDALRGGGAAAAAPPLEPAPRGAELPLSYGQERLWLMETLSPGALAYAVSTPLAFAPDADAGVLARALDEVVRRHEALRTVFRAAEHGAVQEVRPPFAVSLPVSDLRGSPADVQARAVPDAAQAASAEGFDLEGGPLLRARLLRLDGASVLLVTVHHIAFDGWSSQVLEGELRALYDAFSRGEPSPLPALPVQYADYAAWQRRWVESGALAAQVEFWRRALDGAPAALDLPADRPRPAARTHAGARRWFQLPAGAVDAARALARREGATLYMVLLAAFDVLMARLSGSDDVVVGTQTAGRTREETEGLVGIFVNGLTLRTDLSGDPSFREAVARVRRTALDAYAHQDVPFQRLVDALAVERTLSHPPVHNVSFVLQTDASVPAPAEGDADGDAALPDEPAPYAAEYELTFELREWGGGIIGGASYSTEIFEHETAARFVAEYRRLLDALLADPDAPISAPPAVDEAERRLVVESWNATAADTPRGPLHRLFEAQAAATPDALALVFGAERLTFAELNARANRLARRLVALGVVPESVVALALERSVEMVVALLAVNKAGGAFLPVDPAYPAERRRWMLEDSAARLVLTTSALERIALASAAAAPSPCALERKPSPVPGEGGGRSGGEACDQPGEAAEELPVGIAQTPGTSTSPGTGEVASLSEPERALSRL